MAYRLVAGFNQPDPRETVGNANGRTVRQIFIDEGYEIPPEGNIVRGLRMLTAEEMLTHLPVPGEYYTLYTNRPAPIPEGRSWQIIVTLTFAAEEDR